MTYAIRRMSVALGIAIGASFALGLALALAQGQSIVLWFAYMLDIAGALVIAFALFSAAPTSARKAIARRYVKKHKHDHEEDHPVEGPPVVGDLLLFAAAGVALLALGLVLELAA